MTRIITILFILILSQSNSEACSCIGKSDTITSINSKEIILSGKIISKKLIDLEFFDTSIFPNAPKVYKAQYSMVVEKVYNGKRIADTIEIQTGLGGGDCGFPFSIGQSYIVFASNEPKKGFKTKRIIETNICTKTQLYTEEFEQEILTIKE